MQISAKQLLEVGAHFGHRTNKWNPKMGKYIYTSRNNIHIINIEQTMKMLQEALDFVKKVVENDGQILFVGTKKQAYNSIEEQAQRCGMPYISSRWRGGLFTNFKQVSKSIDYYKELERTIDTFKSNKKILARKLRILAKLEKDLKGLRDFYELPGALYIVDPLQEEMAVKEAKLVKVPVIALLDTDCDPDIADYPIPANDDALRSVKLITKAIADTVLEAKGIPVTDEATEINLNANVENFEKEDETSEPEEEQ